MTRYRGTEFTLDGMWTGEVAKQAGVNPQTLRYYERRGILTRPPRSSAGYRHYPASAVGVLRFVKRAQELGFTLVDIKELLHLADGGPADCARARALAEARVLDLDQRLADLQRMRASLTELGTTCQGPSAGLRCRILVQAIENIGESPGRDLDDGGLCACPTAAPAHQR